MNLKEYYKQILVNYLIEHSEVDPRMERAAADVHAAWMSRNPKTDKNIDQHHLMVPYEELPESEKQKDRDHIRLAMEATRQMDATGEREGGVSTIHNPQNREIIANIMASRIHENWRSTLPHDERYNPDGTDRERIRGERGDVNQPWHRLNDFAKRDNLIASRAAVDAYHRHFVMST